MLGRPLDLRLDGDDPAPEWIVDGLLERETVVLLAADSGAGKSMLCMHLGSAMLHGVPWLGQATHGERIMFIDNENHPRIVRKRLRMFGLDGNDESRVRYFSRMGVQLGAGSWFERTLAEVEDFKPDVIVLDTVASTTKVLSPPDGGGGMGGGNEAIAYLYATVLRPLTAWGAGLLLLHHTRKPTDGMKSDPRYMVLGGGQWRGQADGMLYLERKSEVFMENGITRYPVALTLVKDRDGNSFHMPMAFCSRLENGRLNGWVERWPRKPKHDHEDDR